MESKRLLYNDTKQTIKKLTAIILSFAMIMSIIPARSYAQESEIELGNAVSIKELNKDSIVMTENGEDSILTLHRNGQNITKISIDNIDTGKQEYFLINKEKSTLYSSYTGKTLSVNDNSNTPEHTTITQQNISNESLASLDTNSKIASKAKTPGRTKISSTTKKITYKKLYDVVGKASTAVSIAGGILAILAATLSNPIVTAASTVASIIGGILSGIIAGIKTKSTKHGLKVFLNKYRVVISKHGSLWTMYDYKIYKITKY